MEYSNIKLAYNVYQTAWEENVRRVVVASSNHAANYYEPMILDGRHDIVTPEMPRLGYDYYGWAKGACELLGFTFAVGQENNRQLEMIQLRIGGPREDDLEKIEPGDLRSVRRALAVYISVRDLVQLCIKSIETEDIRNENGVPFQVFYGISNNAYAYWSIVNARKMIGYDPQDNSEIRFANLIMEHRRASEGYAKSE
jgi:nucleoside-diphosphate-sugar epimerase